MQLELVVLEAQVLEWEDFQCFRECMEDQECMVEAMEAQAEAMEVQVEIHSLAWTQP